MLHAFTGPGDPWRWCFPGLMAVNILERNLDAVERVIGFTKKGEVRSSGR